MKLHNNILYEAEISNRRASPAKAHLDKIFPKEAFFKPTAENRTTITIRLNSYCSKTT